MPETSFEEILKRPAKSKCKTCTFIAALDEPLRGEVEAAVAKAIYSDEVLERGFGQIETELNPAPKQGSIRNHRRGGHA